MQTFKLHAQCRPVVVAAGGQRPGRRQGQHQHRRRRDHRRGHAQHRPSKAQAIVDYRKAHGSFKSAEQLALVKGIGLKTVEKNRDRIVVGGGAAAGNSKRARPAKPAAKR